LRIVRNTGEPPHFQGSAEGVLNDIFCQRQIVDTKDPRQRGHHAAGFAPEKVFAKLHPSALPAYL
jgi:hypothetical protein